MVNKKTKIILASKSPRRKEILEKAGYTFDIMPSNFEININGKKYSDALLKECVSGKLKGIIDSDDFKQKYKNYTDILIISADTVVVLDDIIIGKPKNENDAFTILKNLSGKTHFVATGIEIMNLASDTKNTAIDIEKTYVTFKELNDHEILEYIKSAKPLDKAGAYGIQDKEFNFASNIDGDILNVIGFPLKLFEKLT